MGRLQQDLHVRSVTHPGLSLRREKRDRSTMSHADTTPSPQALGIAVLTVSDTRTVDNDTSGATLIEFVQNGGHTLVNREIVPDEEDVIRERIRVHQADSKVDVVLVTGGTGITLRDVTPEAIAPLVTKEIPGFGELFRMLSYEEIGASTIQSRASAALCGRVLVFALPGSTGAIRLAVEKILRPQLDVRTKPCNFAQLLPRIR